MSGVNRFNERLIRALVEVYERVHGPAIGPDVAYAVDVFLSDNEKPLETIDEGTLADFKKRFLGQLSRNAHLLGSWMKRVEDDVLSAYAHMISSSAQVSWIEDNGELRHVWERFVRHIDERSLFVRMERSKRELLAMRQQWLADYDDARSREGMPASTVRMLADASHEVRAILGIAVGSLDAIDRMVRTRLATEQYESELFVAGARAR